MVRTNRLGRLPRIGDGKISFIPNDTDHNGWLLLSSSVRMVGKVQYAQLFEVYGTTYGGTATSTTFGLPPVGDKFMLAAGANHPFGSSGGTEKVTLTAEQMPKHKHSGQKVTIAATASQKALLTGIGLGDVTKPPTVTDGSGETTEAGGGTAHENMPPYLTVNVFIFAGMPQG